MKIKLRTCATDSYTIFMHSVYFGLTLPGALSVTYK